MPGQAPSNQTPQSGNSLNTLVPEPFEIHVHQDVLDDISIRVRAHQWPPEPVDAAQTPDWSHGTDGGYLRELCQYWLDTYDWRAAEQELNSLPQYNVEIEGQSIYFIHVVGSGTNPKVLLLTHGWPGSVYEFYGVIDRLAHPEKYGGDPEEGLTLVIPALPGYSFSGSPTAIVGPRRTAALWARLMQDVLGYDFYIAQGGDWGSWVAAWLAYEHSTIDGSGGCWALHLNMCGLHPGEAPQTDEERQWKERFDQIQATQAGYARVQSASPQSLAHAMTDSPVGVAAWIVEKLNAWSDTRGRSGSQDDLHIENAYTKDQILTNVMMYLVTHSFTTASWFYRGADDEGTRHLPEGDRIQVPTGVANFPAEFLPWPPKSYVQRGYNVIHWTNMERGGHFAAFERPEAFAAEVQSFVRKLRPEFR